MPSESTLAVDEALVLQTYRRAKGMRHAEMDMAIKDGHIVRLNIQEKIDLENVRGFTKLKE